MQDQIAQDLAKAKNLLGSASLIAVKGNQVWQREGRGIRPLFDLITALGETLHGAVLADVVVGKAAALLAVYAGFRAVHARTLSGPALNVLKSHGVRVSYDILTERILNHDQTGFCPMEMLTHNIENPAAAYAAIATKLKEFRNSKIKGETQYGER
ncbi:MAG: DUF1893 domain-containing protein [Firmicutes bacterium]|nr:DUF1893 domain-containing protein [Bacillota bacterium]